ncbi:PfkB family carbohydrate kinase [Paenibacillus sp. y28]|uniref:PfkB family carbohydrate kinase n=1 Tax=Paenibacillus sp. y28 TaxID=3129110 RepID=UPI0030192952
MNVKAAVIGTIFMDCKGFAHQAYVPTGRNLGHVQFVHGGVGRNVAENLGLLGVSTSLVSTVDTSGLGQEVIARLQRSGVDTSTLQHTSENGMGMWLAILEQDGGLAGSISHMPDLKHFNTLLAERGEEIIPSASHLILELDLNADLARRTLALAASHGKPVYGIPGNCDVILTHPELLKELSCFICNDIEAGRLLGHALEAASPAAVLDELKRFVDEQELQSMVVTLGAKGSVFYDRSTGDSGFQPVFPVKPVDSSGAGDAFFSGTVLGLLYGFPLRSSVVLGTRVASWTIESPENNCFELARKVREEPLFHDVLKLQAAYGKEQEIPAL